MREAGQHDDAHAVVPAEHGDTEKVSAAPFAALGFASPRMPPLEGFDVDVNLDDGGDEDEEGETQVDAQRSADALKRMRALEAAAGGSRDAVPNDAPSAPPHGRGLPPGRPLIAAVPVPASPSLARRLAAEPAGVSTLKFPPIVVSSAIQPEPPSSDDRPEHLFSSSRLQFGSVASAPAHPAASDADLVAPRSRGVGRRMGILIAISTAVAVALIAGAWTATQPETIPPVASGGTLTSRLTARVPKGTGPIPAAPPPTVGVVVATPPPAPSPPAEPLAAAIEPLAVPAPAEGAPAHPLAEAAPAPVAIAPAPASVAPTSTRGAVTSKRAVAAAAKKARLTRKAQAAANKRRLRAQSASKAASATASPRPSATRPAAPARGGHGDPDDTLPPTD